jgi:hypothetical protein
MLNTLIGETGSGIFDDATISDFVDRFAAAEIASGMSADVAGLSGLKEIREKVASGELTGDVLTKFGIKDQEMLIFNQLEQQYGLGDGGAESLYRAYSEGGFNIGGVDAEINRISTQREQMRAGLLGGDISAFASVAGPEGTDAFTKFARSGMEFGKGGGYRREFSDAMGSGDFERAQEMINERYEGGAKQATIDFMIQSGDLQAAQIGILEQIVTNTGQVPNFSITGDVSETAFNEAQIILTVTGVSGTPAE